jgi:CRISPR-associated protein Csm3
VCHVFGVPGEVDATGPTLLVVRDVPLTNESAEKMKSAKTDLPFAELKTEVAIDRVTSAAVPRTIERVPAGAEFGPAELVFSVYGAADYDRLKVVIDALQLVEDDYVGGSGSRGSGKVEFTNIEVFARARGDYSVKCDYKRFERVQDLATAFADLKVWMQTTIPVK